MASQTPAPQSAPPEESTQSAAPTSTVGPTNVEGTPNAGSAVIRYVGLRQDYVGPKGSHREITLTQFKEAGVETPFTDGRTLVVWNPENGYSVPKKVFTDAALKVLATQDDLEEGTAE